MNSNDRYTKLGPILSGVEYTVYMYDYINDNYSDPVYTTTLSVPSPSTTTSAVLTTTSRVMSTTTPMTSK